MNKKTMTDLVTELESRNIDNKYDEIITEAKAGEFHDFKNDKYVCGKVALAGILESYPELNDIRNDVVNGIYDESPDEGDKAMMKESLKDFPAFRKTLDL